MTTQNAKYAATIAEKYGPSLTKAMKGEGIDDFKSLFVETPVSVVIQDAEGQEAEFTVSDTVEDATMTWDEFQQVSSKDLAAQNYAKSEAECLGVLGNRMILEVGRFNQQGEVYLESYSLVEFNEQGKILVFESFSDVQAAKLMAAAK